MSNVIEKMIEDIKRLENLDSDNKVGMFTGIDPAHLNKLKNRGGNGNAETFIKLATKARWSMEKAQKELEAGFANVSTLLLTALASIAGLASFAESVHCILC